jgi:hypothetical protein
VSGQPPWDFETFEKEQVMFDDLKREADGLSLF